MAKLLDKVMNLVKFDTDEEEIETEDFVDAEESFHKQRELKPKNGKVVNINTTTQLKVVVVSPETFDEAHDIAEHLKQKTPVVINLEAVDKNVARRIVDFLSGSVDALDGNIQKISTGIFLIAPYNVGIMGDFQEELKNKGVFPWNY